MANSSRQLDSQRRSLGWRYRCGHQWIIEVIKAMNVERIDPGKWVACSEKGGGLDLSLEALQHLMDGGGR